LEKDIIRCKKKSDGEFPPKMQFTHLSSYNVATSNDIGGGVDPKESPLQGAIRELREEAGIITNGPLEILGSYYNVHQGHDDYVTVYICKEFTEEDRIDPQEILEKRWFPLDKLPEDISPGCLRRIQEYLKLKPVSDQW